MSNIPPWMFNAVQRLAQLERAVDMHKMLIEQGELPREAVDEALWSIHQWQGCSGGCCG